MEEKGMLTVFALFTVFHINGDAKRTKVVLCQETCTRAQARGFVLDVKGMNVRNAENIHWTWAVGG